MPYRILDDAPAPGGAWRHAWRSLRLFSPARWSSLPGWIFPGGTDSYPTRDETIAYLGEYEQRYALEIERPVRVVAVRREAGGGALEVETSVGTRRALAVISATGTWSNPRLPDVPGRDIFEGVQVHSAHYVDPTPFAGRRVIVVGGGNSGAQIQAEVSLVARATWATLQPPRFLPDDVDGRELFEQATARWRARQTGEAVPPLGSLGDIVMVPPVREARDRGDLRAEPMFTRLTERGVLWPDGREEAVDAIIWCTGYRPALAHLAPLALAGPSGRIALSGTRAVDEPRLWLAGYGDWTGYASATLIGISRSARATVEDVVRALDSA